MGRQEVSLHLLGCACTKLLVVKTIYISLICTLVHLHVFRGLATYRGKHFLFMPTGRNMWVTFIIFKSEADSLIFDFQNEAASKLWRNIIFLRLCLCCRHEKSRNHASIACGHFLRKLWTFLSKLNISGDNFE